MENAKELQIATATEICNKFTSIFASAVVTFWESKILCISKTTSLKSIFLRDSNNGNWILYVGLMKSFGLDSLNSFVGIIGDWFSASSLSFSDSVDAVSISSIAFLILFGEKKKKNYRLIFFFWLCQMLTYKTPETANIKIVFEMRLFCDWWKKRNWSSNIANHFVLSFSKWLEGEIFIKLLFESHLFETIDPNNFVIDNPFAIKSSTLIDFVDSATFFLGKKKKRS